MLLYIPLTNYTYDEEPKGFDIATADLLMINVSSSVGIMN